MRILFSFILIIVLLSSCQQTNHTEISLNPPTEITAPNVENTETSEQQNPSSQDNVEQNQDPIKQQLANMTLKQKIGQLFVVGFDGLKPNHKIKTLIQEYQVGGIILFSRNIKTSEQLLQLTNDLKQLNQTNQVPLFISVDEEGGRVSRLPDNATKFPSNLFIGGKDDPTLTPHIGFTIGTELSAHGFNMDFAPVIDIFSNPNNVVIGDRAYGKTPEIVEKHGLQFMSGLQKSNIIPVVKHFPGHGDTLVDSHKGLPVVNKTIEELKTLELRPFQQAIQEGADVVMAAHIQYPNIDKSGKPSSLSNVLITELLRNEMDFEGVVITDDMEMGAIKKHYGSGEAAVNAIQAGVDLLLYSHQYDLQVEAIQTIENALNLGDITEQQLNESVERILRLKEKYGLSDQILDVEGLDVVGSEEHQAIRDKLLY
ncbi:beta-N-acetylhexosaminidase [Chengkuizengella axinellae]|uniref:beta-N-acetylhexosaminidase n=1 Tax=Chengkuizengella axinellae TaxID=3064388 RepID=A0ABT9J2P7_9BACL|nr:beta-N-acetylhexosaminidase [Chengkuizengella sp. 2205SS18-9]MDP5275876.1 beta-N-acetylhexosaminidase [Chengkuizengella sp. 2205SS18-9]